MEKVEYMDNGTVAAIGDTTTSMINGTTGEKDEEGVAYPLYYKRYVAN